MVAAGFIYITNSPLAWLEWVISDPTLKVKNINKLISDLITIANEKEASIIITSFDNFQKGSDKLKKIYEDCGFKSIGSNMTLMTRGNINKSFLSEEFFKI